MSETHPPEAGPSLSRRGLLASAFTIVAPQAVRGSQANSKISVGLIGSGGRGSSGVAAMLSPGSFGHGGAFSTQSWADPAKNLIWIIMFERDGKGNPDNSDLRIAFQDAAASIR